MRQQKYLFALLMLLAVFAACKGESPTAPPTTSTSGNGGGTPVTGATVTLTASPATALVSTPSVITATVTQNNQPVPNGTAVEFTTDFGSFSETGEKSALRTTTNGVATVTLTSSTAGKATIQAVVNNVSKTTSVTFNVQAPPTCPPDCGIVVPTITGINPAFGSPGGGETVTITGSNLKGPVRVFFDFGAGTTPKEAFVVSATESQIVVTSPPVDLGAGQTKNATIIVVTQAGTASEVRVPAPSPFVYQAAVLTPIISTVSPDSGPIDGGTRITIFGSGFQAPVQVSFAPGASAGAQGWTAIQVVSVRFDQIVAITPAARDVNPTGSGVLTGPVDLRVRNINSNTEAVKGVAFQYKQKMQITSISPTVGTSLGGTEIRIDGIGFNDPVTVDLISAAPPTVVRAQVIRVSATEIVARTGALASPCLDLVTTVTVTNVDNGDVGSSASPQIFTYVAVPPSITSIVFSGTPPLTAGSALTVSVLNPGVGLLGTGAISFSIGDKAASTSPSIISTGTGTQTFSVVVPPNLTFPTVACTASGVAGTQFGPASFPITFTNTTTNCPASGVTPLIQPPGPNNCVVPPPVATVVPAAGCAAAGNVVAAGSVTGTTTITIGNSGGAALNVGAPSISGPNSAEFTISPNTAQAIPGGGGAVSYTVTFDPASTGAKSANVTFSTNDPARPTITVCLTGNGT